MSENSNASIMVKGLQVPTIHCIRTQLHKKTSPIYKGNIRDVLTIKNVTIDKIVTVVQKIKKSEGREPSLPHWFLYFDARGNARLYMAL